MIRRSPRSLSPPITSRPQAPPGDGVLQRLRLSLRAGCVAGATPALRSKRSKAEPWNKGGVGFHSFPGSAWGRGFPEAPPLITRGVCGRSHTCLAFQGGALERGRSGIPLVSRLRLGTEFSRGSASHHAVCVAGATPALRSKAEPWNEGEAKARSRRRKLKRARRFDPHQTAVGRIVKLQSVGVQQDPPGVRIRRTASRTAGGTVHFITHDRMAA
ncbi:hypothetical protein Mal15_12000 [Stieleria maiorica]|uniref:Uncharacterized protein n=1 Tax=Stieleria maiorica TaxID=2795974 RepID=A0A5B9M7P7_9BACT|nr:hypothetical protein Mal15_12000 [Stieleria maiorica]